MPACGNNDSTNVLLSSTTRFKLYMSTQYKTLTISHVKGRTFEKHLNYIPRTNLLHTKIYLHTKKKQTKTCN